MLINSFLSSVTHGIIPGTDNDFLSKILHTSANWQNLHILEAWEINICRNPLNRYDGMHLPHKFLNPALRDRT